MFDCLLKRYEADVLDPGGKYLNGDGWIVINKENMYDYDF